MTVQEPPFPDLKDWSADQVLRGIDDSYLYERKYDGTACVLDLMPDGNHILWGRGILKDGSRQVYTKNFPEIMQAARKYSVRARIYAELVCFDENGKDSFNLMQQRATRKDQIDYYAELIPATFLAYDITYLEGHELMYAHDYSRRREFLNEALGIEPGINQEERICIIPTFRDPQAKKQLLKRLQEEKFEGIVAKYNYIPFGCSMYKYKPVITEDVIWYGQYKEGTGKNEGKVGSMICHQYVNGKLMEIGKVGGITDAMRDRLTDMTHSGEVCKNQPLILEIKAMARLPSGKFRSPRFVRIRHDKGPEQCKGEV